MISTVQIQLTACSSNKAAINYFKQSDEQDTARLLSQNEFEELHII